MVHAPEAQLVHRVDIEHILARLQALRPRRGVRVNILRRDVDDADVALPIAAGHRFIPVRFPEGVTHLAEAALVGGVHVVDVVLFHDVAHRQLALLGLLAVEVVVPPVKLRLRHLRVDLALDHDVRIRHAGQQRIEAAFLPCLRHLPRRIMCKVVVVVVLAPYGLGDRTLVFRLLEQPLRRGHAPLRRGVVVNTPFFVCFRLGRPLEKVHSPFSSVSLSNSSI